jgi:predicted ester cyclase
MADLLQVARENVEALNAHDPARLRATYADDAVLETPDAGRFEGGEQVTGYVMVWLRAFPDAQQTIVNQLVSGNWIVSEFSMSGTHTGTLESPDGDIPPTNRRGTARGVQIQRVEGGKIAEEHLYFDQLEILTQLGLLPEPATA